MNRTGNTTRYKPCRALLAAILLLSGCTETLVRGTDESGEAGEIIAFRTPAPSRAVEETFVAGDVFSVWGYYTPTDAASTVFDATSVSTPDGSRWSYHGARYWKADKTYDFYALYPAADRLGAAVSADFDAAGRLSVARFDAGQGADLMAAVAQDFAGRDARQVPLTFKHLLARIEVVAKRSATTEGIVDFNPVVHSAKLHGMYRTGSLSMAADDLTDGEALLAAWSIPSDAGESPTDANTPFSQFAGPVAATVDGVPLMEVLLFPQRLSGEYRLDLIYSTDTGGAETKSASIQLTSLPLTVWEAGKRYRYTFTLSEDDRILFEPPTVNAWSDAVGGITIVE